MKRCANMQRREHIRDALRYLERIGATPTEIKTTGSGHIRIAWAKAGRLFRVSCSATTKDAGNAGNEICRDMRRVMERDGVTV